MWGGGGAEAAAPKQEKESSGLVALNLTPPWSLPCPPVPVWVPLDSFLFVISKNKKKSHKITQSTTPRCDPDEMKQVVKM